MGAVEDSSWLLTLAVLKLLDRTSMQLRSCVVDGRVLCEAFLVSVTGDSHDVPVGNSSIKPQSYCRRSETVVCVGMG